MTRRPKKSERPASFKLFIHVTNAAFGDDLLHLETARILNGIAARVEGGEVEGTARNSNGNTVAAFRFGHDKP